MSPLLVLCCSAVKTWSSVWFSRFQNAVESAELPPCTHFPFPNQLPTQATTAGQPVVCMSPFITCSVKHNRSPFSLAYSRKLNMKRGMSGEGEGLLLSPKLQNMSPDMHEQSCGSLWVMWVKTHIFAFYLGKRKTNQQLQHLQWRKHLINKYIYS